MLQFHFLTTLLSFPWSDTQAGTATSRWLGARVVVAYACQQVALGKLIDHTVHRHSGDCGSKRERKLVEKGENGMHRIKGRTRSQGRVIVFCPPFSQQEDILKPIAIVLCASVQLREWIEVPDSVCAGIEYTRRIH